MPEYDLEGVTSIAIRNGTPVLRYDGEAGKVKVELPDNTWNSWVSPDGMLNIIGPRLRQRSHGGGVTNTVTGDVPGSLAQTGTIHPRPDAPNVTITVPHGTNIPVSE
jgi:hypothetical protein